MGAEVEGLPGGPSVGRTGHPLEGFGPWFEQERRLRGISLRFVAAHTKLPLDRIRAIESGAFELDRDGRGRASARALALSIGADPEEAAGRLRQAPRWRRRRPALRRERWVGWGPVAAGLLLSLLGVWAIASWLERPPAEAAAPLVYRQDYVEQLLREQSP